MDGRARRTQRIVNRIREAALALFTTRGVDKVTMDDVAAQAHVSKVTIYKYFHSKDELQTAAIDLYVETVLAASTALLQSDLEFPEKLKRILVAQIEKPPAVSEDYLFELLEKDQQAGGQINAQLKQLLSRFYEEGRKAGYIDASVPFDVLHLHSEIYQAGFKAKLRDAQVLLADPDKLARLLDLYFFGVLKRR